MPHLSGFLEAWNEVPFKNRHQCKWCKVFRIAFTDVVPTPDSENKEIEEPWPARSQPCHQFYYYYGRLAVFTFFLQPWTSTVHRKSDPPYSSLTTLLYPGEQSQVLSNFQDYHQEGSKRLQAIVFKQHLPTENYPRCVPPVSVSIPRLSPVLIPTNNSLNSKMIPSPLDPSVCLPSPYPLEVGGQLRPDLNQEQQVSPHFLSIDTSLDSQVRDWVDSH